MNTGENLYKIFFKSLTPDANAQWDRLPSDFKAAWDAVADAANRADLVGTLDEIERRAIVDAMRKYHGHISRVAFSLGISQRGLHYKIKRFEIDAPSFRTFLPQVNLPKPEEVTEREIPVPAVTTRLPDDGCAADRVDEYWEEDTCG